ncbi:MAG: hypothetical protein ACRDZV_13920, partial [Acidimicrobiia bacterium]
MHTFLRAVVTTAVAAGSLGVGAIAGAGRSEGSVGIRLLDVPERHRDDAEARIYIVDDVEPGRSISRRVGVSNQTFTVLAVDVYAGAARVEGDQFVPLEPGATNDLTTWT